MSSFWNKNGTIKYSSNKTKCNILAAVILHIESPENVLSNILQTKFDFYCFEIVEIKKNIDSAFR